MQNLAAWQYTLPPAVDASYQEVLKQALSIFEKDTARSLPFEARLEAAEALGRAGDPRLAEGRDNWVHVEGGTFWMGAQKKNKKGRNYDPEEWGDEGPVRQVTVGSFLMGVIR